MKSVLFMMLSFLSGVAAGQEREPFLYDLKLLTTRIDHYKADKLRVDQALELLFEKAGVSGFPVNYEDDKGQVLDLTAFSKYTITLDLSDVEAGLLIRYIGELAGSRMKIWGWPGTPYLQVIRLTAEDDTDLFHHSIRMECSEKAAKALGLKPGMDHRSVRKVFERYGVEFGREAAVLWNEKTGLLAARGETTGMIPSLVRLAELGHLKVLEGE